MNAWLCASGATRPEDRWYSSITASAAVSSMSVSFATTLRESTVSSLSLLWI